MMFSCLESCNRIFSDASVPTIIISGGSDDDLESGVWPLYKLTNRDRKVIHSPTGWLNDGVIFVAEMLILQLFPNISNPS